MILFLLQLIILKQVIEKPMKNFYVIEGEHTDPQPDANNIKGN